VKALTVASIALIVFASSCAFVKSVAPVPPSLNVDAVGAALVGAEAMRAYQNCKKLSEKPVAYPEEAAIGGAIALALGRESKGGLFVELSPEVKDLATLDSNAWANKKPAPGKGPKTDLNLYLNNLGKGLAAFSDRPTIDWTFTVLDNEAPNAFSAPGGYVFITTGMLRQVQNEAQLAAVLAHEIGHVSGKHAIPAYQESKLVSCVSAYVGGKASAEIQSVMGPLANQLENLPFADDVKKNFGLPSFDPNNLVGKFVVWLANRVALGLKDNGLDHKQEMEADAMAARILSFAGYDVSEFEKLVSSLPDGGGSLTKHPSNKDRLAEIARVKAEYADFAAAGKAPALSPTVAAATK
jgi:hypothetical protein